MEDNFTEQLFTSNDSADENGFAINSRLKNRYILIQRLGIEKGKSVGAFGLVYLAEDSKENHRKVVVKTLKDEWLNVEYIKKHFFQEAEAMNRIHHDGVVSVRESGAEVNGRPFFVIDYAEGKTLREILQIEVLDLERAANLIKEISFALDAVHNAKVIHRDLKPENIIVSQKEHQPERIKIIDFGAALVNDSTIAQTTVFDDKKIIGTPAYVSPEQINRNETYVGEVFSLAVIAYEILTGKMAFPAKNFEAVRELHLQGIKEKPSQLRTELSAEVDEVILKGLSINPDKRFQTPIEFAKALETALFNSRSVKSNSAQNSFWKRSLPLAVGCLLLAVLGLGYYLLYSDTHSSKEVVVNPQSSPKIEANNSLAENKPANFTANSTNDDKNLTVSNTPQLLSFAADTLNVSLTGRRKNKVEKVDENTVFVKDDGVRINIKTGEKGFLYIFYKGSTGSTQLIFPDKKNNLTRNEINANQTMTIPEKGWIFFDANSGIERVYVVHTKAAENSIGENRSGKKIMFQDKPEEIIKYLDETRANSQDTFSTSNGNSVRVISLEHK